MAPLKSSAPDDAPAASSATFPIIPRRTVVSAQHSPIPVEDEPASAAETEKPAEEPKTLSEKRILARNRYATFSPKSSARLLQAAIEAAVYSNLLKSANYYQKDDTTLSSSDTISLKSSSDSNPSSSSSSLSNSVIFKCNPHSDN